MKTWKNLKKPPIIVTLFQIRYQSTQVKLNDFLQYDDKLRKIYPHRNDNFQVDVGIDMRGSNPPPIGISSIKANADTKINSYIYSSPDHKTRFEISEGTITYLDERPYKNWQNFAESALKSLAILQELLRNVQINRTSIRFINRFTFNNFDNPQEYFNTLITSSEKSLPYPLRQYGFRLIMDVPNSQTFSVVNQFVEKLHDEHFYYIFDIDVLDNSQIPFHLELLSDRMHSLREIKNEIFFSNTTQKTLDLCN